MLGTCRLHTELRNDALYVMVTPPDVSGDPVPLSLTGLRPESRTRLRELVRGDVIPGDIVDEIVALAPRFIGKELAGGTRGTGGAPD